MTFPFIRRSLPEWIVPVVGDVWGKMKEDATGHDFLHAIRVMELAQEIAVEIGADTEAAMAAGLLHDYFRKEEKERGMLHYGPEAIERLRTRFSDDLIRVLGERRFAEMLQAIALHEQYDFLDNGPSDLPLTAKVLQDADRIEAMGAVGVARAFMFGGAHGLPMYAEEDPNETEAFDPEKKPSGSTYAHFYAKLLRLKQGIHTEPGRRIAEERHRFMEVFVRQFERELGISGA